MSASTSNHPEELFTFFSSVSTMLGLRDQLLAGARDMLSHQSSLIEHTSEIVAG
jgi:hypothetical protein